MPTVRQLEYLVAIADFKHFRRAAEQVHTSQPTLSGQLKALEERLGVELVERSRSRVVMTPAGVEILDIARRVLRDVREIRAISSSHNRKLSGVVRLGLTASIGPSLIPRLVHDLRREYPDLKFFVREDNPLNLPNALSDGTYDIAIGPLPFANGPFESLALYDEPFYLTVPSDHALAGKSEATKADLKGLGVLTLEANHPLNVLVSAYCATVGAQVLRDFPGTSLDTLSEMVSTGLGVALLPGLYVKSALEQSKTLRSLALVGQPLRRTVGMVWRGTGAHSSRYGELAHFVKKTTDRVVGPF